MAITHSRCYFSIIIQCHGNDAGGPIVQHSCAMNTQCVKHFFFVIACLCQRRGGVPDKGVEVWLYSHTVGWTQVEYLCLQDWQYSWILILAHVSASLHPAWVVKIK